MMIERPDAGPETWKFAITSALPLFTTGADLGV